MFIPEEEAKTFYELYQPVLGYAASRNKSLEKELNSSSELDASLALRIRDFLFSKESIIQDIVSKNPLNLSDSELDIVDQWSFSLPGKFIIERVLKKHAIFLDSENPSIGYGVLSLNSSIERMIGFRKLPVVVSTVLIPWNGKIIHDGLFSVSNASFGVGIRDSLKESYKKAKQRGIITDFSSEFQ